MCVCMCVTLWILLLLGSAIAVGIISEAHKLFRREKFCTIFPFVSTNSPSSNLTRQVCQALKYLFAQYFMFHQLPILFHFTFSSAFLNQIDDIFHWEMNNNHHYFHYIRPKNFTLTKFHIKIDICVGIDD